MNTLLSRAVYAGCVLLALTAAATASAQGYRHDDRHDHWRGRHYDRRPVIVHDRPVYRPYGYYAPPPVVYSPPPPSGVSLFFRF